MLDAIGIVLAIVFAIIGYRYAAKLQQYRSLDGYALKQLQDAGINIQQSLKLEFWFYSNENIALDNIAKDLTQRGFEVHVSKTEETPRFVMRALKSMEPELATLQNMRKEFVRLAKDSGAEYDGWGLSALTD